MIKIIKSLALHGIIRQLDYQFSRFMWQQSSTQQDLVTLISMLVSHELGKGNVCIDLNALPVLDMLEQNHRDEIIISVTHELNFLRRFIQDNPVPEWETRLQNLDCIGRHLPLVINNHYLYLNRYWQYEKQLADNIKQKSAKKLFSDFSIKLDELFPGDNSLDWQKVAAAISASQQFSVISGGPGTGKTTTITRILALLIRLYEEQGVAPGIKLVAPTGKAAARLNESMGEALKELTLEEKHKALFPAQASTIHRLLKTSRYQSGFVHNKDNPLVLDVLIVDEASMVDLPLMSKLVSALPERAQLILLGDKDQLSSVEAGSVLGDICSFMDQGYSRKQLAFITAQTGYHLQHNSSAENSNPFADNLCQLKKSYRFDRLSGIGQLANAVNSGNVDQALKILNTSLNDIEYIPSDSLNSIVTAKSEAAHLVSFTASPYRAYIQQIKNNAQPAQVIQTFNEFRLLCATRNGERGVKEMNRRIEQQLTQAGLLEKSSDQLWYIGRPVMLSRNNYELELYNGDIGITMMDDAGGKKVFFEMPDKSIRGISPGRLSECETVYAMTIHKSQGSEFNHVALLFPDEDSPLLARELLYTGITRAKKKLSLFSSRALLRQAIRRRTARISGLRAQLIS